jgi:exodeoxyribonuclease (lambda-induced)
MMEQGSDEWLLARSGKMTSSKFPTVCAKGRSGGPSDGRRKYMDKVISERKTGLPGPNRTYGAMDWGTEHEDEAVSEYEKNKSKNQPQKVIVRRVGFIELSDWIGGSPDGLVGEDGIIEVKCPDSSTQYRYSRMLLKNPVWFDPTYRLQIQGNMWLAGAKWCDWISYDPRYKMPKERLLIVRVPRDELAIAELQVKCEAFKQEALAEIRQSNPF